MDKKTKLLVICFVILCGASILIGFYAFVPDAKASMDYYLGPTGQNVTNGLTGLWIGVTTSEAWLTYITPNLLWIGVGAGILVTSFILLPIKDAWTGFWSKRHKVPVPTPMTSFPSTPVPQTPTTRPIQTAPAPAPEPTPASVVPQPEKKEET